MGLINDRVELVVEVSGLPDKVDNLIIREHDIILWHFLPIDPSIAAAGHGFSNDIRPIARKHCVVKRDLLSKGGSRFDFRTNILLSLLRVDS